MTQTLSLLQDLGHVLEEHAMVTDLEAAWRDYNQMNSVQTVLEFDDMAKASRAADPGVGTDRVQQGVAWTRACAFRSRLRSKRRRCSEGQSARTGGTAPVRRVPHADPDSAAPAGRLLGPERARFRQIYREMDGRGVSLPLQSFRPAGGIRAGEHGPRTTFRSACSSWDDTAMRPRFFASPRNSSRRGRGSSAAHQSAREHRPTLGRRITVLSREALEERAC